MGVGGGSTLDLAKGVAVADAVAADDQAHFNSARAPDRDAALAILKGAFSA